MFIEREYTSTLTISIFSEGESSSNDGTFIGTDASADEKNRVATARRMVDPTGLKRFPKRALLLRTRVTIVVDIFLFVFEKIEVVLPLHDRIAAHACVPNI